MSRLTIQDIANSVGVPVEQVSKVILGQAGVSDDMRRRIIDVMGNAGLVRMSRETAKGTIGIAIPGAIIDDYIGTVVSGASELLRQQGYSLVLSIQNTAKADDLEQLVGSANCAGMILVVPSNYDLLLDLCQRYQRPYVLVDYQDASDPGDALTVEVNNRQSIVNVMDHLFDLGHRRIGFITGNRVHASAQQRLQGYLDALEDAGIAYDPALVGEGNWMHPRAYDVAQNLLNLDDPPTAIVASNDLSAFGAMQAARGLGLEVGSDVSITGFDDIGMASTVTPTLTTVRQPMLQMGHAAAEMLLKASTGQPLDQRHVQLDTELIIRQSTARPRN